MKRILKKCGKYWYLLLAVFLLAILQAISDIGLPTIMGDVIGHIQEAGGGQPDYTSKLIAGCILIVVFAILSADSAVFIGMTASKLVSSILADTRQEMYEHVDKFSMNEMNKFTTSSLLTRITNDFTNINLTLNLGFRYIIYGPLVAIIAIILMLTPRERGASKPAWQLMLVVLGGLIIILALIIIIVKFVIAKMREIQKRNDHLTLVTRESLEGLRVVRAYNAESYQEEKYAVINQSLTELQIFTNKTLALFQPTAVFVGGSLSLLVAWIGSFLVQDGTIQFKDITIYTQYCSLILIGIFMMIVVFVTMPRALTSAKRIYEVIDTPFSIVDAENPKEPTEVGTIEFKDVSYTYPGAEMPVVDHLSFKVEKGQTVAFIGATGSGKSTVVNLLLRFFDATEGEILVDGANVKDYKLDDLFKRFGYVPQRGYLFHDSLKNNVCVGKTDATEEQLKRALDISQSSDFVAKLPGGVEYEVSQGGKNVSGGQRQRLCIARAIIMEPEIFVFDDSFSALDYRTDKILRRTIKEQCAGTTNVIIAQRVGTIIDADQIIVLDGGKVVGQGTHDELLKKCDVYKEIADSQLGKEGK